MGGFKKKLTKTKEKWAESGSIKEKKNRPKHEHNLPRPTVKSSLLQVQIMCTRKRKGGGIRHMCTETAIKSPLLSALSGHTMKGIVLYCQQC